MKTPGEHVAQKFSYIKEHMRTEWVLIFVLGLLVGIAAKVEASKHITMGFNDYMISDRQQAYDFEQMAKTLAEEQQNAEPAMPAAGASCGQ